MPGTLCGHHDDCQLVQLGLIPTTIAQPLLVLFKSLRVEEQKLHKDAYMSLQYNRCLLLLLAADHSCAIEIKRHKQFTMRHSR